jgi:hypothetical protein
MATAMSEARLTFVLTIRTLPNTDSVRTLRQLLKHTLRWQRFECVAIREESPPERDRAEQLSGN